MSSTLAFNVKYEVKHVTDMHVVREIKAIDITTNNLNYARLNFLRCFRKDVLLEIKTDGESLDIKDLGYSRVSNRLECINKFLHYFIGALPRSGDATDVINLLNKLNEDVANLKEMCDFTNQFNRVVGMYGYKVFLICQSDGSLTFVNALKVSKVLIFDTSSQTDDFVIEMKDGKRFKFQALKDQNIFSAMDKIFLENA